MATSIRAVIVSVYGTILEKADPLPDGEGRWTALCAEKLGAPPEMSLAEFNAGVYAAVARSNEAAARAGILHPVAYWPSAARSVLPALARLGGDACEDFLYAHAQIRFPTRVVPGAVIALRKLHRAGIVLGLVSNGHPHTPVELALAMEGTRGLASAFLPAGLLPGHGEQTDSASGGVSIFARPLCFWGYSHGFGLPDPHVFRHLTRRLELRGIAPAETMIVSGSDDRDLEPARQFGWQCWRLASASDGPCAGNWFGFTGSLGIE